MTFWVMLLTDREKERKKNKQINKHTLLKTYLAETSMAFITLKVPVTTIDALQHFETG